MKKIIFILGGARSGKSRYAVEVAKKAKAKTVFIATATAWDDEMKQRIRLHRLSRPRGWALIEEPKDISGALRKLDGVYRTALIDCLGLWVSNLLMDNAGDKEMEKRIKELAGAIRNNSIPNIILVSNEVGHGIVPGDPLSRRFRDLLGLANQAVAQTADEVFFMQAGIPVKLK